MRTTLIITSVQWQQWQCRDPVQFHIHFQVEIRGSFPGLSSSLLSCPVLSSPRQKAFVCLGCSMTVDAAASVNGDNNFLNWNWMKWFAYNIIYTTNANKLRRTEEENERRTRPRTRMSPWPHGSSLLVKSYCMVVVVGCRIEICEKSFQYLWLYIGCMPPCGHFANFHCFLLIQKIYNIFNFSKVFTEKCGLVKWKWNN